MMNARRVPRDGIADSFRGRRMKLKMPRRAIPERDTSANPGLSEGNRKIAFTEIYPTAAPYS